MIIKAYKKIKELGLVNTFHELLIRSINKIFFLKIYRCMVLTLETLDPKFFTIEKEYDSHFIENNHMKKISSEQLEKLDMPTDFIQKAIDKNDYCYGILKDEEIVSYGWYSNKTTEVTDDLELRFKPNYIYQYKGFTLPEFRGKRLHAIGMAKSLQELSSSGIKGLIAIVESTNFSSRRSVYRLGYRDFGKVIVVKIGKRYRFIPLGECDKYGFSIHPCN